MTGGNLGEFFSALAFASAGVSMVAFFLADSKGRNDAEQWSRLGIQSFVVHIASVIGIIATLFGMIYLHQYEYHYVWAHSSNELPVYYMISCFWEGQEGSFLLWAFWHSILAIFILRRKNEWRNGVMGVIASVELILTSMVLGIYVNESWVTGVFILLGMLPMLWMIYRYLTQSEQLAQQGQFHLLSILTGVLYFFLLFSDHVAFQEVFSWRNSFDGVSGVAYALASLFLVFMVFSYFSFVGASSKQEKYSLADIGAGLLLIVMALMATYFEPDQWKIGSTPFTLLKDTFPNDPEYLRNPDFVPSNGTGLNPLLQNYWMVIHPPTLFLGFASTLIPFAYVMAGLIRGKYQEWIRPAMPWVTFSVLVLGVGIIMGGYWAYETLNFGGYWNWDPVENSSFVPWLCGVASLHALLIYRKTKAYLRMAMILIISTFLLVLVSTFLTRSGILGETSVHTFTDLGLSGQLLVLLFFYTSAVVVTLIIRWRKIPAREDESKVWSAEFMLFLGILVFIFSSVIILFATSLPVFNAILGTNMAPAANVQLFYYLWTVWFAIAFGILSGIGQFLWWKVAKQKSVKDALFRPFLLAMLSGSAILIAIWVSGMEFAFDEEFKAMITEDLPSSFIGKAFAYIKFGFYSIEDELLLFASLFALLANIDVLISLLRKNRKGLKVMGGTVVHIGFALMLIGMLFSSGYDKVISTNPFPEELSLFPEDEKRDNVALPRFQARPILGYNVTYLGRKRAETPIENLRVLQIEQQQAFKLAFEDVTGETYAMYLPLRPFQKPGANIEPTADTGEKVSQEEQLIASIDLPRIERSLNRSLAYYAEQINGRTHYGLKFTSDNDEFIRYTESEMQGEEGILPHPARKVYWNRDIYFYTSSLPNPDSLSPKVVSHDMQVGDTVELPVGRVILRSIGPVQNPDEDLKGFDLIAAANLEVLALDGNRYEAKPLYLLRGRQPDGRRYIISELDMEFAFMDIKPNENRITLWISYIEPEDDLIVIKAISKPFINLLWLGTFILTFGFILSIVRRIQENRKMR
jgi:cytochrome c-type biogenesis protein CcmF